MSLAHDILPRNLSVGMPLFAQQKVEEAYELGFQRGWGGSDGPGVSDVDRPSRRLQEALPIAMRAGYEAAIRWVAELGGPEEARRVMTGSPAMAERAERTWQALNDARPSDWGAVPREPCCRCQWIAGCARTAWDCPAFRSYVQREGTRGLKPAMVPDGPLRVGNDR
jgi:hypothetical protein